jgi:hypothetical protein
MKLVYTKKINNHELGQELTDHRYSIYYGTGIFVSHLLNQLVYYIKW